MNVVRLIRLMAEAPVSDSPVQTGWARNCYHMREIAWEPFLLYLTEVQSADCRMTSHLN